MTEADESRMIDEERSKILRIKSLRVLFLSAMVVLIIITMGYSFTVGTANLTPKESYEILLGQVFPGWFPEYPDNYVFIMTHLRAPRVLVGALIGAILAIGGCLMQSVLKNPLATPYTLGVSSGAAVGASIYFIFGISIFGGAAGLITNAFFFSLLPVAAMILVLSRRVISAVTLVLSGVAFSYVFSSVNSIMQYFGDDSAIAKVVFWTIGDLTSSDMWMVPVLGVALAVYLVYSEFVGKDLDIMRMGDDTAASLGVNVNLVRGSALVIACFMTALAVACAGPIGFICLLAPHICRRLVGSDIRWLVPTAACFGSMLLLISDMIAKMVIAPEMLPVGAVTALIGAPIMVYMLYSKKGMRA